MAVSNLITLPEYAKGFAKEDIRRTVIEMFTQYSDVFCKPRPNRPPKEQVPHLGALWEMTAHLLAGE